MRGLGLGLGFAPSHRPAAEEGSSALFPDEGFDDAGNFDFTNAGGRISVSGGSLILTGARSGDFVLLASGPNAAMLAALEDGVDYDCIFTGVSGSSGNPSITLKGGTPVVIPTGSPTIIVTAGNSATEAYRQTGSGNAVSGNATRNWSGLVILPH